jgi:hypothetical protein
MAKQECEWALSGFAAITATLPSEYCKSLPNRPRIEPALGSSGGGLPDSGLALSVGPFDFASRARPPVPQSFRFVAFDSSICLSQLRDIEKSLLSEIEFRAGFPEAGLDAAPIAAWRKGSVHEL